MEANLVFEVILITVLDVLGIVTEKREGRVGYRQLRDVLDFGNAAPVNGWAITFDGGKHLVVEHRGGNPARTVFVNLQGYLHEKYGRRPQDLS